MADNPKVSRPKPTVRWRADWYDGPTGSAMHHQYLSVSAEFAAIRPDPAGAPNLITIELADGDSSPGTLRLNRQGAAKLLDLLELALWWRDEHHLQPARRECERCGGDGAVYEQVRVGQFATPFGCPDCHGDGEVDHDPAS